MQAKAKPRALLILLCLATGVSQLLSGCGSSSGIQTGQNTVISYSNSGGQYNAIVHVPASYKAGTPTPVYVMVHGCETTAAEQEGANLIDPLADAEGFIVVYPDFAPNTHWEQCWTWFDPAQVYRDSPDPDGIAGLVRGVISQWSVDEDRIYLIGMSSGGFMASIVGATYPDLFAAIGIAEAGPYDIGFLGVMQPIGAQVLRPEILAPLAYAAMGGNARVVPVIDFQGDADTSVYPDVGLAAVQQWLMTDNLVISGSLGSPLSTTPGEPVSGQKSGSDSYTATFYRAASGCVVAEQVLIHGMKHFWPGGSSDPRYANFTDPDAPSGAELSWEFFRNYRKMPSPELPCASQEGNRSIDGLAHDR